MSLESNADSEKRALQYAQLDKLAAQEFPATCLAAVFAGSGHRASLLHHCACAAFACASGGAFRFRFDIAGAMPGHDLPVSAGDRLSRFRSVDGALAKGICFATKAP